MFVATILEYENTRNLIMKQADKNKFNWLRRNNIGSDNPWTNIKREFSKMWNQLTPGQRVFAPICALNVIVFGLWRVPALRHTMMTYFCSNPIGSKYIKLLFV